MAEGTGEVPAGQGRSRIWQRPREVRPTQSQGHGPEWLIWWAARRGLTLLLSGVLIVQPGCVPSDATTPASTPTSTTSPVAGASAVDGRFNPEQLDALLASIALYPDELLVQILMASTYPLEVVEAARWLASGGNKDLKGDALVKALEPLPWD